MEQLKSSLNTLVCVMAGSERTVSHATMNTQATQNHVTSQVPAAVFPCSQQSCALGGEPQEPNKKRASGKKGKSSFVKKPIHQDMKKRVTRSSSRTASKFQLMS